MRKTSAWQNVQEQLMHDIVTNTFRHSHALPTPKELRNRYHANYRTVKKALDALVEIGILTPQGRGFALRSNVQITGTRELLVFIYCETEELYLSYLDPHLLRLLESLCHQVRVQCTIIRYREEAGTIKYVNHTTGRHWDFTQSENVIGCIWLTLFPWDILDDLCKKILSIKQPIAVKGNSLTYAYLDAFRTSSFVKFFSHANTTHFGVDMGKHLLELGHRNIAFLCTQIERDWAQNRLSGLRTVFEAAGYPHAITEYVITSTTGRSNQQLGTMIQPLLKKAILNSEHTAWVCSDDFEARLALEFLKLNGIAVPEKLSVAGFNNSLEALKANLTSYDHNSEAQIATMVNYVLQPSSLGTLQRKKVIDFRGYVVGRRSTGLMHR